MAADVQSALTGQATVTTNTNTNPPQQVPPSPEPSANPFSPAATGAAPTTKTSPLSPAGTTATGTSTGTPAAGATPATGTTPATAPPLMLETPETTLTTETVAMIRAPWAEPTVGTELSTPTSEALRIIHNPWYDPALGTELSTPVLEAVAIIHTKGSSSGDYSSAMTETMGIFGPGSEEISVKSMFLDADPIVQGVMILLFVASLITWGIIIEKFFMLRRASHDVMVFKKSITRTDEHKGKEQFPPLVHGIVQAGLKANQEFTGQEGQSEYRERIERAMRTELGGLMDRLSYRTIFLATVGSTSPFIGLFGTVWGIMNSFMGIASSGETTLAVVAPGIAEALFATAMGLVAAIPAVIAYNKIIGTLKKITKEALSGISYLGSHLTREHFRQLEIKGDQCTRKN